MENDSIELWEQPAQEIRLKTYFESEMDNCDYAFICGLIKQKRPKKLLEIGVAEGGTTAVIINCLSMLEEKCEMYSVDLNERFYHDASKKTGYEYERLNTFIKNKSKIRHQMLFGKTIGGCIEEIGKGIDFAILDTVHSLPGEILDFLCILPYLAQGATIVLHDVNLNYIRALGNTVKQVITSFQNIATKLLFSAVVADKYSPIGQCGLTNVGAFVISEDTYRYIENLFYLLTCTWTYIPESTMLQEYRTIYEKHYKNRYLDIFDIAVANNRKMLGRMEVAKNVHEENFMKYRFPYSEIPTGSNVVLYGAGKVGKEVFEAQKQRNIYNIILWVDKRYEQYAEAGLDVKNPGDILKANFDYIVVAVETEDVFQEIQKDIIVKGYNAGKPILGPISKY